MSKDDRELIERLRAKRDTGRRTLGGGTAWSDGKAGESWGGEPIFEYVNPDGPAAAARLEALQAQPVEVVQLGASDQFQWPTESDWQGQTEDQRARFLRSWYDYLKAAALQSPQPLEDEARHALIARLQDYRSDWHKRMGDVSVLDAAIAALTASPPVVEREAIDRVARALSDASDNGLASQRFERGDNLGGYQALARAAILALTPAGGVGEGLVDTLKHCKALILSTGREIPVVDGKVSLPADLTDVERSELRGVSTPATAQGGVREALEPFAEIARGEAFRKFADDAKSNLVICNPDGKRFAFINAECFDAALATLTKGARDAG